MTRALIAFFAAAGVNLVGCAVSPPPPNPSSQTSAYTIRPVYPGWVNLHEGAPDLAGVAFANDGGGPEYVGKHPAGVIYAFWDGRVRSVTHDPNGKVLDDHWHRIAPWNRLDYSFGSDPNFERHEDPRRKKTGGNGRL